MQRIELEVEIREKSGKGPARQIRRAGRIPAVLYGEGKSTPLIINPSELRHILHSESGENALINLKIKRTDGKKTTATAILRDFQTDPVTQEILHADLFEVSMNKILRVRIPLVMTGDPAGVKEGGILQHNLRDLEIECLPSAIPDHIEINASELGIGQSIHVREIQVSEEIKVLEDPDQTIVSVSAPLSDAKLESLLAGAPPEEGEKEPEVVGKGKEKEEAEGEIPEVKPAEKPEAKK